MKFYNKEQYIKTRQGWDEEHKGKEREREREREREIERERLRDRPVFTKRYNFLVDTKFTTFIEKFSLDYPEIS